ncbi:MAG TPA: glucan ABC transporter ATP-binding protein/ permease [Alphaproteobacteria bacterium]|nr:glucan ABC transporter ATP-binding protein/ permease [Alphaproteobacteria bacterium]
MKFVHIYRRVLGLLKPERNLAIFLAFADVALAGLQFLEPVLFGKVVDTLAGAAGKPPEEVWSASLQLLVFWGAVGVGGIVANILVALHSDRMAHRRRLAALASYFEHVLSLPLSFHAGTHSGRLLKVMLEGADNLFGIWLAFFREHLSTFVILIVLLPLTLFMNWRLALLLILLMVFFSIMSVIVINKTEKAQSNVQEFHSELAERAGDALGNINLIQSFVRLALEVQQLGELTNRVLRAQFPVLTWWAVVTVLTRASSTLTVIAIFMLGTWLFLHGLTTVGEIVAFMGFATLLIGRLEQAMSFAGKLFFQMHSLEEYFGVLDARSSVIEKPNAMELTAVKGDVAFDHVALSYDGVRDTLADLTFDVKAGQMVAIVGPTGAGKSSAMGLLHRLWDPRTGRITVDGHDIRDITLTSLRRNIGVVFQESTLFYRSIATNLRVGKPDATDEELIAAAKLAQAHDFIMAQPNGYQTLVGERGRSLSGGERQRIAIARALLKDPPILILDEATSALDTVTEAKVQQALDALMQGRTTFVIAHRLSTIRRADQVIVMENGRIVERGGYTELMAKNGAFAQLVQAQSLASDRPGIAQS